MQAREVEVTGRVLEEVVDQYSKSAREALVLRADDGQTYTLRRKDAPAFGDTSLDILRDHEVTARGILLGQTLIVSDWTVLD